MNGEPCCVACGARVPWQWYLCPSCRDQLGEFEDWPEWAREEKRHEDIDRYRIQRGDYSWFPYYDETDLIDDKYPSEIGLDKAFRVCEEMGVDWECFDWDAYQD